MAVVDLHHAHEKVEGAMRYLKDKNEILAASCLRFAIEKCLNVLCNLIPPNRRG
jgi:hypothetical protein